MISNRSAALVVAVIGVTIVAWRWRALGAVALATALSLETGLPFVIARQGAKVMIADYVPEGAERTVKMIKEAGGGARRGAARLATPAQRGAEGTATDRLSGGRWRRAGRRSSGGFWQSTASAWSAVRTAT